MKKQDAEAVRGKPQRLKEIWELVFHWAYQDLRTTKRNAHAIADQAIWDVETDARNIIESSARKRPRATKRPLT